MIIEFLGISGVGKTTLAKEYFAGETDKNVNIKWPRYKLYIESGWLSRNLVKLKGVIKQAIIRPQFVKNVLSILAQLEIGGKDKAVLLYNYLSYKDLFSKANAADTVYLFDEGVFQLIWAAYLRTDKEVDRKIVRRIIEQFQSPSRLYVIKADTQVIIERLLKRGTKTRLLSGTDLSGKIELMQQKMDCIIQAAVEEKVLDESRIITVDNNAERL